MSWQATAWAERQKTGSPSRKVLLLVLANYADEYGIAWPSQETLAKGTEMSVDTIQRQLKRLQKDEIIKIGKRDMGRGRWSGRIYTLMMPGPPPEPQDAARSKPSKDAGGVPVPSQSSEPQMPGDQAAMTTDHHAAIDTAAKPQAMRHEPSSILQAEPSLNQQSDDPKPKTKPRLPAADRQKVWQKNRVPVEATQNKIAVRLMRFGFDGWETLDRINETAPRVLAKLTLMQEHDQLQDEVLICTGKQYSLKLMNGTNR